jgi:hypothetical protein
MSSQISQAQHVAPQGDKPDILTWNPYRETSTGIEHRCDRQSGCKELIQCQEA